jgi:hypothetical protein
MAGVEKSNLDDAEEVRSLEKTKIEVVSVRGAKIGRATFKPGWRWSECVGPVVGGSLCQAHHLGVIVSGRLGIRHKDGSEVELGPGDAYDIQPGHDAWVVSEEPCVGFEFDATTADTFAQE